MPRPSALISLGFPRGCHMISLATRLLHLASFLLFAVGFHVLPSPVVAQGVEAGRESDSRLIRAAAALYEGVRTETLPNGLRIYLRPIPEAPVVTTMVAYNVGAADEELDQTGLSHYLEH